MSLWSNYHIVILSKYSRVISKYFVMLLIGPFHYAMCAMWQGTKISDYSHSTTPSVCLIPMGALSLPRRRDLRSGGDIYEIKLGDEFLMSSLFTASEIALARLELAGLSGTSLAVVGGLGL